MKVIVRHGHFAFYPDNRSDILHFRRLFKIMLYAERDYFTFLGLVHLPNWSQIGTPVGVAGTPAIANYAGDHPSEVLRANRFVYSMQTSLVVPIATFAAFSINFSQSNDFLMSPKLFVQPGCMFSIDQVPRGILTGYTGHLDLKTHQLTLSSVEVIV